MADMLASGEVRLLLSPNTNLGSNALHTTIIGTKGFCLVFTLYYFITYPSFFVRQSDRFIFHPPSPAPSVNVAAEHVIIL